jgi:hypothetical protein
MAGIIWSASTTLLAIFGGKDRFKESRRKREEGRGESKKTHIEQNLRQRGIQLASPRLDVWQRNPNVLISSSPEQYPHHSELQQPRYQFIDPLTNEIQSKSGEVGEGPPG